MADDRAPSGGPSSSRSTTAGSIEVQINGQVWPIAAIDELSIGRDPAAAIPLDDTRVSRHHAVLRRVDDGWLFEDLGSSNGSFLDTEAIMALHIDEPVDVCLGDPHFGPRLTLTPILAADPTPTSPPTSRQPDAANASLDPDNRPAISGGFLIDTAPSPTVQIHRPTPNGATPGTEPPAPDQAGLTAPELDGEQLFREVVRPTPPPRPPYLAPTPDGDPELTDGDEPTPDIARLARIFGLIVIGIGILALISTRELPLPAFLIAGGAVLAFYIGSPNRLTRDQIVDRWDCLIAGAQGRGDEVLAAVTGHIDRQKLPNVEYDERDLAASLFRGGTRTFLVIWQDGNGRLGPYRMHVNVRDYGTNLQTSWFLTYHRSFFERLKPNPLVALNLFDEQDLRAYVTAVHHGFLDAVVDLMIALGQDTSKLDRKTNGFLGIS